MAVPAAAIFQERFIHSSHAECSHARPKAIENNESTGRHRVPRLFIFHSATLPR